MSAENYHLKWDSHLSYLNSSVATLYKNEKFADVVLYSSSSICGSGGGSGGIGHGGADVGIPTVGISAHKFILSSCSQFFATMFETAPLSAANSVLYVVLPPDLSHRAIQILVQYMYSGEATVSNDILNEVLRGGEILKIRGLCRTSAPHHHQHPHPHHHAHQPHQHQHQPHQPQQPHHHGQQQHQHHQQRERDGYSGRSLHPPQTLPSTTAAQTSSTAAHEQPLYGMSSAGGKCSSMAKATRHYALEQQLPQPSQPPPPPPHLPSRLGLGASVMPKDSPVIVKSPKMAAQLGSLLPPPSVSGGGGGSKMLLPGSSGSGGGGGGMISINKEVAIDPEDKCCYQLSVPPEAACRDAGCLMGMPNEQSHRRQQHRRCSDDYDALPPRMAAAEYAEQSQLPQATAPQPPPLPPGEEVVHDQHRGELEYERRLRHNSADLRDFYLHERFEAPPPPPPPLHAKQPPPPQQQQHCVAATTVAPHVASPPPHGFLHIKQEPADWSAVAPTTSSGNGITSSASDGNELNSDLHCGNGGGGGGGRGRGGSQSPKEPLDFKMLPGSATVKIEAASSAHSNADDDEFENNQRASVTNANAATNLSVIDDYNKSFFESSATAKSMTATAVAPTSMWQTHTATTNGGGGGGGAGDLGADALSKCYVPKKRRRVSQQQENNMDHVQLQCDLCATSFETPAEWVRHMNSQHTEIELAMYNNSKKDNGETKRTSPSAGGHQLQQQQQQQQQHKKYATARGTHVMALAASTVEHSGRTCCDVCSKRFSSHGTMLLHRRSHLLHNGNGNRSTTDEDSLNDAVSGSGVLSAGGGGAEGGVSATAMPHMANADDCRHLADGGVVDGRAEQQHGAAAAGATFAPCPMVAGNAHQLNS